MTPITYSEAASLLGVKEAALRNAVGRGVLIRLPRTGTQQPLIREQVELFKGKGRLSLSALDTQEKVTWAKYAKLAETPLPAAEKNDPQQVTLDDESADKIADRVSNRIAQRILTRLAATLLNGDEEQPSFFLATTHK